MTFSVVSVIVFLNILPATYMNNLPPFYSRFINLLNKYLFEHTLVERVLVSGTLQSHGGTAIKAHAFIELIF